MDDVFEDGQEIDCTTVQAVLDRVKQYRESLAASRASDARKRALLEKHQWIYDICPECSGVKNLGGHAPDCKWAKEIEGLPNERN